jgi:hypothetical protein
MAAPPRRPPTRSTKMALSLALVASVIVARAAAVKPATPWVPCNASVGICFSENLGSHMVLQQAPAKACVFGLLGPGGHGASVKLSSSSPAVAELEVEAEVTAGNRWKACLAPQKVGGDYTITATVKVKFTGLTQKFAS